MQCRNCGDELVRGFTFCLNCGLPVPDEMLESSGLPPRNIDGAKFEDENAPAPAAKPVEEEHIGDLVPQLHGGDEDIGEALKPRYIGGGDNESGKALKPQYVGGGAEAEGEALKPQYIGGGDIAGEGQKVKAVMHESSANSEDAGSEKLVFCPNCGMHMQKNPDKCEICGMRLERRTGGVPVTQSGIPLFNQDADPFSDDISGLGGFGGFGGLSDMPDISSEDAERIDNFVNSANASADNSLFNTQSEVGDFAQLTEQLANFSASAMKIIEATENTRIRQKEPKRGAQRGVDDFQMDDDLSSETIPIGEESVRVMGDYSMDEDPSHDINLDPYAFINTSMDDVPEPEEEFYEMPSAQPVDLSGGKPSIVAPNIQLASAASTNRVAQRSFEDSFTVKPPEHDDEPFEEAGFIAETVMPEEKSAGKPLSERVAPRLDDINEAPAPKPDFSAIPKADDVKTAQIDMQSSPRREEAPKPSEPKREVAPKPEPAAKREETPKTSEPKREVAPKSETAAEKREEPSAPKRPEFPRYEPPASQLRRCECGRTMLVTDKFCPSCGKTVGGTSKPKGKKPVALIVIIVVLLALVAAYFILRAAGTDIFAGMFALLDSGIEGAAAPQLS